ncbi:T9SS type A sorting domain-containing protein [Owenweeksia hongkongensis]|uniref:T9SS type A sorting domain-containing protein n=1 Tax=Owenweeksia hongkongensis TaxID=253245 RepID=UPI003A8E3491
MKKIYTLFISIITFAASAQVMDVSVADCNNNASSIHAVLGTGKVLVVASDGLDCSICKSKAPGLQSWAAQNKTKIQVWGAMTFTYSNSTPTCTGVDSWVNSYGWTDIYTFVDANRHWFMSGTPRYTVYSALDSSLAYQGFDENAALNTALQIAGNTTVGIDEVSQKDFYVSQSPGAVRLHNLPKGANTIQLVNLTGQVVKSINNVSEDGSYTLLTSNMNAGIYLVSAQNNKGFKAVRKVYVK